MTGRGTFLLRHPAPLESLPGRDLRQIETDAAREAEAEWERKHLLAAADRSVDLGRLRPKPVWRDYVSGRRVTAFVRVSRSEGADGIEETGDFGRLYVYEVYAPGGIDVHETFRRKAGWAGDLAFPGGIAPTYAALAHELIRDYSGNVLTLGEPMYPSQF